MLIIQPETCLICTENGARRQTAKPMMQGLSAKSKKWFAVHDLISKWYARWKELKFTEFWNLKLSLAHRLHDISHRSLWFNVFGPFDTGLNTNLLWQCLQVYFALWGFTHHYFSDGCSPISDLGISWCTKTNSSPTALPSLYPPKSKV